jgi:HlyD family secretion protein
MKSKLPLLLVLGAILTFGTALHAETISAMGRVLPSSGVFDISGPGGDTVETVLAKEGEWVDASASLARLSSTKVNAERVANAESELAATQTRVTGDIDAAKEFLASAEEEFNISVARLKRIESARDSEFISPDTVEIRTLAKSASQAKFAQARQDLKKTETEGRKAVRAAEAEVREARAALAASSVQAPIRARVLKVLAKPGQTCGRQELFKLGDTTSMKVVAEVYESDILKIKEGQRATISSVALPKPLDGVVENVSRIVYRNTVQSMDPSAQVYARVVEVVIRMDAVEPLDRLVYLQVDVKIAL